MTIARALAVTTALALSACGGSGDSQRSADQAEPAASAGWEDEATIGVPVAQLDEARRWYETLLGREVDTVTPVPGVVELRITGGTWLQLFTPETPTTPSPTIVRLATADIDAEAQRLAAADIDIGEIVRIPSVVAYAEFADPFGNGVGLYQVLGRDD